MSRWLLSLGVALLGVTLVACSAPESGLGGKTPPSAAQNTNLPDVAVGVLSGSTFRWRTVGGDPCNPNAGCILEWALQSSGWPAEVQAMFLSAVRTEKPEEIVLENEWKGWMTWGQYSRKFHPNTVADWRVGQREPAHVWRKSFGGRTFNLFRVHRCKNWGGNVSDDPVKPTTGGAPPLVSCQ